MLKSIDWSDLVKPFSKQIKQGIFLSSRGKYQDNTMIIGWGGIVFYGEVRW